MERDVYWKIISLPEERGPSKALINLLFLQVTFSRGSRSLPLLRDKYKKRLRSIQTLDTMPRRVIAFLPRTWYCWSVRCTYRQFLLDGLTAPSLFVIYYITTRSIAHTVFSFTRLENIFIAQSNKYSLSRFLACNQRVLINDSCEQRECIHFFYYYTYWYMFIFLSLLSSCSFRRDEAYARTACVCVCVSRANRILFNSIRSRSPRRTNAFIRRHRRRVIQFNRARSRHVSQRLRMQNISFTGKSTDRLRQ